MQLLHVCAAAVLTTWPENSRLRPTSYSCPTTTCSIQRWVTDHIHALQPPARSKGGSQIIFMPYSHLLDPKVGHRSYSCPTTTCSIQRWVTDHSHALQPPARSKGGSQIIFMPYNHLLNPKVGHKSYSCPTTICSIQKWVTNHIHALQLPAHLILLLMSYSQPTTFGTK